MERKAILSEFDAAEPRRVLGLGALVVCAVGSERHDFTLWPNTPKNRVISIAGGIQAMKRWQIKPSREFDVSHST